MEIFQVKQCFWCWLGAAVKTKSWSAACNMVRLRNYHQLSVIIAVLRDHWQDDECWDCINITRLQCSLFPVVMTNKLKQTQSLMLIDWVHGNSEERRLLATADLCLSLSKKYDSTTCAGQLQQWLEHQLRSFSDTLKQLFNASSTGVSLLITS